MAVLIIEDDPAMQELLAALVKVHDPDATILTADTVDTALAQWRGNDLSLILCDLGLSGSGGGMTFVKAVRQKDKNVPIVLVTGNSDRATVVEGARYRVNGFIAKPFDPTLVAERLKPYFDESPDSEEENSSPVALLDWLSDIEARFPSLSVASGEAVDLADTRADAVSVRDLARKWDSDAAITARLIYVANNQLLKRRGQSVKTVLEAINTLGVEMSAKLILVERLRHSGNLQHPYLKQLAAEYSERSLAIANQAAQLANRLGLNVSLCYTAGVMAYLGEQTILEAIQKFIDKESAPVDTSDIDQSLAQLGSRYGNQVKVGWRLPLELRERAGAVHQLQEGTVKSELILMHAAACQARDQTDSPLYAKLKRQLGLVEGQASTKPAGG